MNQDEFLTLIAAAQKDVPLEVQPAVSELEEFMKGRIWRYLQALLQSQKRRLDQTLRTKEGVEMYREQGRAQQVDNFLLLPMAAINVLKVKKQIEEKKNAEQAE